MAARLNDLYMEHATTCSSREETVEHSSAIDLVYPKEVSDPWVVLFDPACTHEVGILDEVVVSVA